MNAPEEQRRRLFDLIWKCQGMDWLLLTKRPAQARDYLLHRLNTSGKMKWPWPNVWLGVTAGSQPTADAFIPILISIPAYVRWISHEPAIAPIDWWESSWTRQAFAFVNRPVIPFDYHIGSPKIHWIVSGGESGASARSISEAEFRKTRRFCQAAGIKWFMKQMGTAWAKDHYGSSWQSDHAGKQIGEWPPELRVQEFPEVVHV